MTEEKAAQSESQFVVDSALQKPITCSSDAASHFLRLLERIVTNAEWDTARDLMTIIRNASKTLSEPTHMNSVVGNMVRRVLKVIRDEYSCALGKEENLDPDESLQKMLIEDDRDEIDFSKKLASLRKSISANIRELIEECERSTELIAAEAPNHIHSNEVIMTYGFSRTVEKFLYTVKDRGVEVIIIVGASRLRAVEFALRLKEKGFTVSLIPDNNILNFMPIVNKVIVGTHAVMGNGGLKATAGVHPLAVFADYHKKPFYALAPVFKLTPQFVTSTDQEGFNHMLPPDGNFSFEDPFLSDVEIINPAFDYVPPDLVKLIIFNNGANPPSYVYRPLQELYHPDDYDLSV